MWRDTDADTGFLAYHLASFIILYLEAVEEKMVPRADIKYLSWNNVSLYQSTLPAPENSGPASDANISIKTL
ncbi:hypothetical protein HNY73_022777 [Argiope bruennichi]|uniref:Uncharacterized protein n=1 Tax=Argiope bruennichi TaxID=94029 RepID=A0A8T0E3F6_ARGBR|nr:hypothetical protein HNY73_022777 [Argiope bruennichi]